jgi:hypothetical protein
MLQIQTNQEYVMGVPLLRPRQVLLQPTFTCNICAYYNNQLKPNGKGQNVTNIGFHIANDPEHQRRAAQGRQPPAWANGAPSFPNPPQYRIVAHCICCTLEPDGTTRLGAGYTMNPESIAEHLSSGGHLRRKASGRVEHYLFHHQQNMLPLPDDLW